MKLYDMTNQLGHAYFAMEDMHEQASKLATGAVKKKLQKKLAQFSTDVEKYKATLVSLEGDFYVEEGTALREEISTLYFGISNYPGVPSDRQLNKIKSLASKMNTVQQKLAGFQKEMAVINELLVKAELTPIKIKSFEEYMAPIAIWIESIAY